MSMRVLLIIALLSQLLWPIGLVRTVDASASGGPCGCGPVCCCSDGSVSDHCNPQPADVCMCNANSQDPEPGPMAPPTRNGKELAPFLALSLASVVAILPEPFRQPSRPKAQPSPTTSHNEVQALLCVWRT